jgi:hypothetical protein
MARREPTPGAREVDQHQPGSPSGLIARMWELAEWEGRPVSNQGTARWATQDGETLAILARRLLDGMEEEKDAE